MHNVYIRNNKQRKIEKKTNRIRIESSNQLIYTYIIGMKFWTSVIPSDNSFFCCKQKIIMNSL